MCFNSSLNPQKQDGGICDAKLEVSKQSSMIWCQNSQREATLKHFETIRPTEDHGGGVQGVDVMM